MGFGTIPEGFERFPDWTSVLAHVRKYRIVWYVAGLAREPGDSCACKLTKNGKGVRMLPAPYLGVDPFTADETHFDRFRRRIGE